jgi:hypothetical protein
VIATLPGVRLPISGPDCTATPLVELLIDTEPLDVVIERLPPEIDGAVIVLPLSMLPAKCAFPKLSSQILAAAGPDPPIQTLLAQMP